MSELKSIYTVDVSHLKSIIIDSKTLSIKQLYEVITSQRITIDALLSNKNAHITVLQEVHDCIEHGLYNEAKIIIKDTLKQIR